MSARFTDAQVRRYSRQILMPGVGGRGQQRLLAAAVSVDLADAAGPLATVLLAAAGVGRIALVGPVDRAISDADVAFPLTRDDRRQTLGAALRAHVARRNPDVQVLDAAPDDAIALVIDDVLPAGHGDASSRARAFERAGAAVSALLHAITTGDAR